MLKISWFSFHKREDHGVIDIVVVVLSSVAAVIVLLSFLLLLFLFIFVHKSLPNNQLKWYYLPVKDSFWCDALKSLRRQNATVWIGSITRKSLHLIQWIIGRKWIRARAHINNNIIRITQYDEHNNNSSTTSSIVHHLLSISEAVHGRFRSKSAWKITLIIC